jgi:hypothetical protein
MHDVVLIGSRAARYYITDYRKSNDVDIVATYEGFESFIKAYDIVEAYPFAGGKKYFAKASNGTIIECDIAWPDSSAERLIEFVKNDIWTSYRETYMVPTLNFLYMLKMSHRYLRNNPHFLKTMEDIHYFRKLLGSKEIYSDYLKFYKRRMKDTYWYKHPKLNVAKADFFKGDGIEYIYDHDSVHQAVRHLMCPAYVYYLEDGEAVKASKKKFFEISEKWRLFGVLEEAQVLALERSQIPFKGKVEPFRSFEIALMKVCTSITSGWFREFAWENYHKVMEMYESDYVDKFWTLVDAGKVKPYTGSKY